MSLDPKRVMNGTYGEVWLDDDKVSECTALQAKATLNKIDIYICGRPGKSHKVTGWAGTGSLKLLKTSSRMIQKTAANIRQGKETYCTIISKLADPDAWGAERVVLKNVAFDEVTLADWEANKNSEETLPFTFDDYDFLDLITPVTE